MAIEIYALSQKDLLDIAVRYPNSALESAIVGDNTGDPKYPPLYGALLISNGTQAEVTDALNAMAASAYYGAVIKISPAQVGDWTCVLQRRGVNATTGAITPWAEVPDSFQLLEEERPAVGYQTVQTGCALVDSLTSLARVPRIPGSNAYNTVSKEYYIYDDVDNQWRVISGGPLTDLRLVEQLPASPGETAKLYIRMYDNTLWRWDPTGGPGGVSGAYVQLTGISYKDASSAAWVTTAKVGDMVSDLEGTNPNQPPYHVNDLIYAGTPDVQMWLRAETVTWSAADAMWHINMRVISSNEVSRELVFGANLPATGDEKTLYIRTTDNTIWRWDGTQFYELDPAPVFVNELDPTGGLSTHLYIRKSDNTIWRWDTATMPAQWVEVSPDTTSPELVFVSTFPSKGDADKLYIRINDNTIWRWNGITYVEVSSDIQWHAILPLSGSQSVLYIRTSDNTLWRWDGSNWSQVAATGGGGGSGVSYVSSLPAVGDLSILYVLLADLTLWHWTGAAYQEVSRTPADTYVPITTPVPDPGGDAVPLPGNELKFNIDASGTLDLTRNTMYDYAAQGGTISGRIVGFRQGNQPQWTKTYAANDAVRTTYSGGIYVGDTGLRVTVDRSDRTGTDDCGATLYLDSTAGDIFFSRYGTLTPRATNALATLADVAAAELQPPATNIANAGKTFALTVTCDSTGAAGPFTWMEVQP